MLASEKSDFKRNFKWEDIIFEDLIMADNKENMTENALR